MYKEKGDALSRGKYRELKLIDQVMKVMERVADQLIRKQVRIDDMQFGFSSGKTTTDAIFIVRQLQEKHLAAGKLLYLAFVDLEKALIVSCGRSSGVKCASLVLGSGWCELPEECMQTSAFECGLGMFTVKNLQ